MNFEQLAAQYSNMIHSIIHSLHIYKDHDEFYQIGLIALWNAYENFDEAKGRFSTYGYRFIKGRMLNHLKKEKKQEDYCSAISEEVWLGFGYEACFLERETLLGYFYRLTDKEQQWVLLRFYEGLSNSEIADRLDLKVTSVRSCERRAMRKLVIDKNSLSTDSYCPKNILL
ncbi:sigma-70 family RNA polymerase sigma factor [Niallia sp. XMNu-256]|uniref:sigma-70 family RNA polymerase sigma factor n=1 Tax=Niallia sp. XMNu-256 TaxID=3082444 RepID=UPI0030CE5EA4